MRNNIAYECRCHVILVDAPHGSVDHNAYFCNSAGAFALEAGASFGPAATNLSITENIFRQPGQIAQHSGAFSAIATNADGNVIATPLYEKINISKNTIDITPGPALIVTSARDFYISRNQIADTNRTPASPQYFGTF